MLNLTRKFRFLTLIQNWLIINLYICNSTFASYHNGLPPIPDLLFPLTQKVSKKVKTSPASLEKFAFGRLNPDSYRDQTC